ncbi:reverse [Lasius niger]|uniref:Reverse n=1 Tax=Lasius niger TaxID=67767 RepID=A0A0J7K588_LASNI|nr:reverse [Lasius niger]
MEEEILDQVLNSLFPRGDQGDSAGTEWPDWRWDNTWEVLPGEVDRHVKKRPAANKAPGPDGLKATLWRKVPNVIVGKLAHCYNLCLKEGIFQRTWKKANLVLIPKGKISGIGLLKVRPICLLNEIGKTFERVIADRIWNWIDEHPEAGLSDNQFGFRTKRSTCDALKKEKRVTKEAVAEGGVAIAVGLDIANAFNSLP